jgi:hypothetical protein
MLMWDIWNEKDQEEARNRQKAPEARKLLLSARSLLDEAEEKLFDAGELELFERVHFILGVLWGLNKVEDLCLRTS